MSLPAIREATDVRAIRDEPTYLEVVHAIRGAVELVDGVPDAKQLADNARAAEVWARRVGLHDTKIMLAIVARLWAERRAGELLRELVERGERHDGHGDQRAGFGRGTPLLVDLGITKRQSHEWQRLASIEVATYARLVDDRLPLDRRNVSAAELLRLAGRSARDTKLREQRQQAEEEARASGLSRRVEQGDLRTWRPGGPIAAIVTDPPYITDDAVDLHSALADFALDVLEEGGALVVMTWQPILVDVIAAMSRDHLAFRWAVCWRYATSERTPDQARRVFDGWKPVLVYHKGAMPGDATFLYDVVDSENLDKGSHEWGQSIKGFRQLVKAVTEPGETVCDPFVGGGTTAAAALSSGRAFVGCDIDEAAVHTTRERVGSLGQAAA